jgi:outer membrane protein OmpA-like peptidoglycan-associated protein
MTAWNSKLRLRVLGLSMCSCLASWSSYAGDGAEPGTGAAPASASRGENVGIVTGLAVGAVAAGPIGAMVGAAAGGWFGDRYHRDRQRTAALNTELARGTEERVRLARELAQREDSLTEERSHAARLDATLQQADQIGLDVGFRTDDDGITAQTVEPLLKLGALVASLPQASVRVAGYTDPRGSAAYNEALSLRRAQSVAAVLEAAGVPSERILIEAHGKGTAMPGTDVADPDTYALARRVTVRVELAGSDGQVARRE